MRRLLVWLLMICKRLLKKPGFIIIFSSLIILTGAMVVFSGDDGSIITVALFAEDKTETASAEIISKLCGEDSLINYIVFDSEKDARDAVGSGDADAAWLLPDDLGERLHNFTVSMKPVVTSVMKEKNIYTMLASEKLNTVLYPRLSFGLYYNFIDKNVLPEIDDDMRSDLTDAEIRDYYEKNRYSGELVGLEFYNSDDEVSSSGFLLSPLRGMLALAVSLTALASVMYFFTDRDRGVFAWVPIRRQIYVELGYVFVPVAWAGLFTLIALRVGGLFTSLGREAAAIFLYCLMCTVFSVLIGRICSGVLRLGAVIPAVMLAELALSPVFINPPSFAALSRFFPPYHYLNAIYDSSFFIKMAIYIAVGGILCILTRKRS